MTGRKERDMKANKDFCDLCSKPAVYECEICEANYCRACASKPDEGGWNCYDEDCPGFGEKFT